jgi:anti-sigma B factor antagonist
LKLPRFIGSDMGSADFELQESPESGWLRLTLLGELDLAAAPVLEARLGELQAEGRSVLLDLSQLDFMDSTGLAIMTRAISSSTDSGWKFVIDPALSPQVQRLFRLTAVDRAAGLDDGTGPRQRSRTDLGARSGRRTVAQRSPR